MIAHLVTIQSWSDSSGTVVVGNRPAISIEGYIIPLMHADNPRCRLTAKGADYLITPADAGIKKLSKLAWDFAGPAANFEVARVLGTVSIDKERFEKALANWKR